MNKRLKKKKTLKVIHISNTVLTPSGHNKKIGKRKRKKFFVLKTSVKSSDIRTMLKCYACMQAANIQTANVYGYMNNSASHCTDQKKQQVSSLYGCFKDPSESRFAFMDNITNFIAKPSSVDHILSEARSRGLTTPIRYFAERVTDRTGPDTNPSPNQEISYEELTRRQRMTLLKQRRIL